MVEVEHTHLDLHQVHGLHERWLGSELACIQDSACCGNDLAAAAVDGVRVQRHVVNVKANSSHVLLTKDPLPSGHGE